MQKIGKIILAISIVINVILGILFLRPSKQVIPISVIDSLENSINILQKERDSIRLEIDTVYVEIKSNSEKYEKTRDNILKFTPNEDYDFFTSYLAARRHRSVDNN